MPSLSAPEKRYTGVRGHLDMYWMTYIAGEMTVSALLKKCSYV